MYSQFECFLFITRKKTCELLMSKAAVLNLFFMFYPFLVSYYQKYLFFEKKLPNLLLIYKKELSFKEKTLDILKFKLGEKKN